MNKHKWYNEIVAWASGAEVEIREVNEKIWDLLDIDGYPPFSDEDFEFRIKPQPKEPQYLYVFADLDNWEATRTSVINNKAPHETYIGKIKLEQDDE